MPTPAAFTFASIPNRLALLLNRKPCVVMALLMTFGIGASSGAADNPLVSVQLSPDPQVEITWTNHSGTLHVLRRDLGSTNFDDFTSVGSTENNIFTDSSVTLGKAYEYSISSSTDYTDEVLGFTVAVDADLIDERGEVLLVIDDTLSSDLAAELDIVELDLVGDGWIVHRLEWGRHGTGDATGLRAAIQDKVADHPEINTLYFFGKLPMVYSGYQNPDGHGARPHVTDWYYADVDGTWTDFLPYANDQNNPGDGIYDSSHVHPDVRIAVGRVTLHDMGKRGKGERELLRDYVHKAHAWKHGHRALPDRAMFQGSREIGGTEKYTHAMFGGNANAVSNINTESQGESVFLAYSYDSSSIGSVTMPSQVLISANFKSHRHRWWESGTGQIMRHVIAQTDWGLNAYWGARPEWYLHHMSAGLPVGFSTLFSIRQNYKGTSYPSLVRSVYMAMMGDPTTRMHPIDPPNTVTASRGVDDVNVTWQASSADNLIGYHVYRSEVKIGPYTRLTLSPVSQTNFTDSSAPDGALYYQVRAIADMTDLPTGSYRNQSQGVFGRLKADGNPNNAPMVAGGGSYTVKTASPIPLELAGSDADGDPLTPIVLQNPKHGQLRWDGDNVFYQSYPDFVGEDSLTYILHDGIALSESNTILIEVEPEGRTLLAWEFVTGKKGYEKYSAWNQGGIASAVLSTGSNLDTFTSDNRQDQFGIREANGSELDLDQYIAWTLSPENGYRTSLDRIIFGMFAYSSHLVHLELRVSDDGFTTHEVVPLDWNQHHGRGTDGNEGIFNIGDLSGIESAQNLTTPLEFRLYIWHNGDSSDIIGLGKITGISNDVAEDLVITGTRERLDGKALLKLDRTDLEFLEGGQGQIRVKLSNPPEGPVEVTSFRTAGDDTISIIDGTVLTFTESNWDEWQTVTIGSVERVDDRHEVATITIGGENVHGRAVVVTAKEPITLHHRYDESDGQSASDKSGNGHTGSLAGTANWEDAGGRIGGALRFNGEDNLVLIENSDLINLGTHGQRTVSLWFRADDPASTVPQVLFEEGGHLRGLALYVQSGEIHVFGWNDDETQSNWTGTVHSAAVEANTWHHVVLVLDGGAELGADAFRGYLDGISIGNGPGSQLWEHASDISVGGTTCTIRFPEGVPDSGGYYYTGLIDDLRIYNRALTPENIWGLVLRGTGNMPISTWREFFFNDPDNSGDGENNHDFIGDGISNLTKYALGLNPFQDSSDHLHLPKTNVSGDFHATEEYPVIEYRMPNPPPPDVTVEVQTSTSLLDAWFDDAILVEEVDESGRTFYRWRSPHSLQDEGVQFMRLKFTTP